MEVDIGGEGGSDGSGEGGSGEGLSPPEDGEDGGVDELVEELAASSGELSSRAASFPTVSLPSECWVLG